MNRWELEKCCICGEEYMKREMFEIFTGRVRYMCPKCRNLGNRQIDDRHEVWRGTARGKAVIEQNRKNK